MQKKLFSNNRLIPVLAAALLLVFGGVAYAGHTGIDGITGVTTFNFTARADHITTADGGNYLIWGYADNDDHEGFAGTRAQYPGPTLIVNQGETITINLTNALSEPVSEKRGLALEYGADAVLDPMQRDLNGFVFETTSGVGFETVFECSGVLDNVQAGLDACARGGVVCIVSVMMKPAAFLPATLNFKEVRLTASYSNTHEENRLCLDWMAKGKLDGHPLISDLITLDELPGVYQEKIHTGKILKVMLSIGEEF